MEKLGAWLLGLKTTAAAFAKGGWSFILAIPDLVKLIKTAFEMWADTEKLLKEKENERIREEIRNAQTEQDFQDAVNRLANRYRR